MYKCQWVWSKGRRVCEDVREDNGSFCEYHERLFVDLIATATMTDREIAEYYRVICNQRK